MGVSALCLCPAGSRPVGSRPRPPPPRQPPGSPMAWCRRVVYLRPQVLAPLPGTSAACPSAAGLLAADPRQPALRQPALAAVPRHLFALAPRLPAVGRRPRLPAPGSRPPAACPSAFGLLAAGPRRQPLGRRPAVRRSTAASPPAAGRWPPARASSSPARRWVSSPHACPLAAFLGRHSLGCRLAAQMD